MNQEIKTKWVEALRSGKYTQGSMRLRSTNDGFCCLGVLCDVIDPKLWGRAEGASSYHYGDESDTIYVPRILKASIGLNDTHENDLSIMNDKLGYGFEEIADYIEENL